MSSILLVAHAPLASALQAVGRHAFPDCGRALAAVDIEADATLEQAQAQILAALRALPEAQALILVDAFGATPCNAALALADGEQWRVVTGANVPMLWRTLCYSHLTLSELVARAVDGGQQGILQVSPPRRQNQPNYPRSDDPLKNPDQ